MGTILIAGFLFGFSSSLHCIGMCGPLTLMIPANGDKRINRIFSFILYHSGRIFVYMLLGTIFSLAGRMIYISGLQQYVSITAGTVLLIIAIGIIFNLQQLQMSLPVFLTGKIRWLIIRIVNSPIRLQTHFLLGAANGILPCGMVYIALVTVLSFSNLLTGIGFMAAFGSGTLPALFLFSIGANMLGTNLKIHLRKLSPFVLAFSGLLLLLRGLNLAIPFLSPQLPQPLKDIIVCH